MGLSRATADMSPINSSSLVSVSRAFYVQVVSKAYETHNRQVVSAVGTALGTEIKFEVLLPFMEARPALGLGRWRLSPIPLWCRSGTGTGTCTDTGLGGLTGMDGGSVGSLASNVEV